MRFLNNIFVVTSALFCLAAPRALGVNLDLKSVMKNAETGKYVLATGLFNSIFAKEMCSCLYVDHTPLKTCIANSNLPSMAASIVKVIAPVSPDDPDESKERVVSSKFTSLATTIGGAIVKLGPPASAKYVGAAYGCVMTSPAGAAVQ